MLPRQTVLISFILTELLDLLAYANLRTAVSQSAKSWIDTFSRDTDFNVKYKISGHVMPRLLKKGYAFVILEFTVLKSGIEIPHLFLIHDESNLDGVDKALSEVYKLVK